MRCQVFSERCSGSNLLESFIDINFPSLKRSSDYGFKHWLDPRFLDCRDFPRDHVFLLLIRDPFDWIRSIHAQPWHAAPHLRSMPISEFLRSEWWCVWDEQAHIYRDDATYMNEIASEKNPVTGCRFSTILEVRSVKYRLWDRRLSSHSRLVRITLENFLASPSRVASSIASASGVSAPSSILFPAGYKGRRSWRRSLASACALGKWGAGYKPREKPPFEVSDLEYIVQSLDAGQESGWGYDLNQCFAREKGYSSRVLDC